MCVKTNKLNVCASFCSLFHSGSMDNNEKGGNGLLQVKGSLLYFTVAILLVMSVMKVVT